MECIAVLFIMKVGILTFHRASNYGAVLQAYALSEMVKKFGCSAEIIDYRCPEVEMAHRPFAAFKKQKWYKAAVYFIGKCKNGKMFDKFRTRMFRLSEMYTRNNVGTIKDKYDIFISGSDQVWSKRLSGFDKTYLLDFVDDDRKKYSYAASFGFTSFPENTRDVYQKYLEKFQMISLREKTAVDLLKNECSIDSCVCLDPTLILGKDEWMKFSTKPDLNEKYILIYTVQPPVGLLKYARKLSEEKGLKLIYLNNSRRKDLDIKHIRYSTPEEFVGFFANAEYVLTNSFHGTAFSIIFNKELVVEIKTQKSVNTRSEDLLKLCEIDDRIINDNYSDFKMSEINWQNVNQKLENEKKKSVEYLKCICKD